MPFVSLNQKELQKILAVCSQISPRVSDVEIFTFTKVIIKKDKVEINAFNSTIFYRAFLRPTNIDIANEEISFLIKTDLFTNSVSLIHDEIVGINIDLDKTSLVLQGSNSKHTLRINTEELSNFTAPQNDPEKVQAKFLINSNSFIQANKIAQVSVGNPRTVYQPEFLHICYTLNLGKNQIAIVSTDRYRMAKILVDVRAEEVVEELKSSQKNYLINPKSLNIIASIVNSSPEMEMTFESELLWVRIEESQLAVRYGEGVYPDYDKILPQSFACSFMINTKEALDALRQVFYLAKMNTNNKSVTLHVEPTKNQITLSTTTSDGYSSESTINITNYEGNQESWTQSFNAEYLIDYISNVSTERILWESNPSKPSLLSPENQKSQQIYLVSGLR